MTLLDRTASPVVGFAAGLHEHGGRPALATRDTEITYAELARRADAVGDRLGTTRRLVLIEGANTVDVVATYLGALRGGHVPLLVPGARAADAGRIRATFDPDVVVTGDGDGGSAIVEQRRGSIHELHPELALLLTTSGSTGAPRTVRLSHTNLDANAAAIASYLGLDPEDRAATTLPLHYCYGLSVLHSHLLRGASVALTDLSVVDACFWELFRERACTSFAGVPYTFELLDRIGFEHLRLPSLRYVTQAGGRLDPERVRRYAALGARDGWDLVVMYGQTEATARMAYLPPHLAAERPEAIGVPIPGGSFEIEPVDGVDGGVGELVYRGRNVMLGYASERSHFALGRTVHELRTGDLGRLAPDGLYEIVGRTGRFAKIAGSRIDLDDVELGLRRAGFDAVCTSDDRRLLVGIVRTPSADVERAAAAAGTGCGLPPARVAVRVLDEIPRLPNGKPDLAAVRSLVDVELTPDERLEPDPPSGAHEVHPGVRALIADVLRVREVDADDTFVSLGGDSLSYVEVSMGLEALLVDLPEDWHVRPLRELAPAERAGSRRHLVRLETSIVVRAVAIVAVVANHIGLFHVLGGAHALLGVAGWNYARFERGLSDRLRSIGRIAVPSALWLAFAAWTITPRIDLDHVLLVHNWVGDRSRHGGYWYIETLVHLALGVSLVLALPPVARVAARRPFATPIALAVVGLLTRFDLLPVPVAEPHDIRPHDVLWIFALGWAAARAHSVRARLLVTALLAVGLPGYFDEAGRDVVVFSCLAAVVWLPSVPVPRFLLRPLGHLAAASLAIYLTHWQVFPTAREELGRGPALALSLLAGVLAWWLGCAAARLLARALHTARDGWRFGRRDSACESRP